MNPIDVAVGAAGAVARRSRVVRRAGEASELVRRNLEALGAAGAARRERARRQAGEALLGVIGSAGLSWPVNLIVDAQLARILPGVVDKVLHVLEDEPDRLRTLVRGQRETMVDEVVGRVRDGAAAGDAAVDRLTSRLTHRSGVPRPPGAP